MTSSIFLTNRIILTFLYFQSLSFSIFPPILLENINLYVYLYIFNLHGQKNKGTIQTNSEVREEVEKMEETHIHKLRIESGQTQDEAADSIGLTQSTFQQWEAGNRGRALKKH